MKLRQKLLVLTTTIAVIPTLVASLLVGFQSYSSSRDTAELQAQAQLISIRDIKKQQIEQYFAFIQSQIQTFSNSRMVIDAVQRFRADMANYRQQTGLRRSDQRQLLKNYYTDEFGQEFSRRNGNTPLKTELMLKGLDADSISLQYDFIVDNPHPLGSKDQLTGPDNSSDYAITHRLYHPAFRDYLNRFGYYDIFLADPVSGDIVYSVFKELDFTTSLIDGPYAQTGIGEAFRQANAATKQDATALTDFASYLPSYQDPAAFIASPIFDGDKKVGILIFQMPVDRINSIMTHEQAWAATGLGASGETYLVGSDFLMRSMSRFLIEDSSGYIQALQKAGTSDTTITAIEKKQTSIGLQPVQTPGTKAVFDGQTGFALFPDYRQIPVLSAYAPLNIAGLNWGIMSEIDKAEAFQGVDQLLSSIAISVAVVTALTVATSLFISVYFSNRFTSPIGRFTQALTHIRESSDLTLRVDADGQDELSQSGEALNALIGDFQQTIRQLRESSHWLKQSSADLGNLTQLTKNAANHQQARSQQVAQAALEMTSSAQAVADNAERTAQVTQQAHQLSQDGQTTIDSTMICISDLATDINEMTHVLAYVSEHSNSIGSVLNVISEIAEQTNLLALNAAIEAARAGEQGRGFAVVADEVRALAQRTHESTQEITTTIERLQSGINDANRSIISSSEKAKANVDEFERTKEFLQAITDNINSITTMNQSSSSAAVEQLDRAESIAANIKEVSEIAGKVSDLASHVDACSRTIDGMATKLDEYVAKFKMGQ